jgi:dTDP-4-amino-4,6-dideoxygalactose transaminase
LHTALASLDIRAGDEVITTPFSFVATASCILMQNAKPVFTDICPDTYNIDPNRIEENITSKTKVIIVVHLYGQPCDMNRIMEIANRYNIRVIEDACQAHGAEYHGRKVGSIGHVGVFSFYPTKNMTTGEGGAITTNDEQIAEKARMIRDHGQKQRYWHEFLGYNYRMTNIAAAIGLVQLKRLDELNGKRIRNAKYFIEELKNIEKPFVADNVKHVFHLFTIRVKERERFVKYLQSNRVGYGIYYPSPIHKQPLFKEHNGLTFSEAEMASEEVVSLPVYPGLSEDELKYIVQVVNSYEC